MKPSDGTKGCKYDYLNGIFKKRKLNVRINFKVKCIRLWNSVPKQVVKTSLLKTISTVLDKDQKSTSDRQQPYIGKNVSSMIFNLSFFYDSNHLERRHQIQPHKMYSIYLTPISP